MNSEEIRAKIAELETQLKAAEAAEATEMIPDVEFIIVSEIPDEEFMSIPEIPDEEFIAPATEYPNAGLSEEEELPPDDLTAL